MISDSVGAGGGRGSRGRQRLGMSAEGSDRVRPSLNSFILGDTLHNFGTFLEPLFIHYTFSADE
jgi:hypothetical protein